MKIPKIQKILYTTALGAHSLHVYRYALQMAAVNNAELIMLHVVKPVGSVGEALIKEYLPAELVEEVHDEGIRRIVDKMKGRVRDFLKDEHRDLDDYYNLKITPVVVSGYYDQAILEVADQHQVDVIVMGSENRLGIQSHKTQRVIRRSKIPVYVVPTGKKFD